MSENPFEVKLSVDQLYGSGAKLCVVLDDLEITTMQFFMDQTECILKVLPSDLASWCQAKSATYIKYSNNSEMAIAQANMSLQSAVAMLNGPDHKFELVAFADNIEPMKQFTHNKCTVKCEYKPTESWASTAQELVEITITFDKDE